MSSRTSWFSERFFLNVFGIIILLLLFGALNSTFFTSPRTGVLFGRPQQPTPSTSEFPVVVNRAFTRPLLPDWYGVDAAHLRTIPLRVIKADADSGLACVETPDGGVVLLRIRGVVALNRGAYFHIVRMKGAGDEEPHDMAEEIPESAIDFTTGNFAEGTTYRRQADEMGNVGP